MASKNNKTTLHNGPADVVQDQDMSVEKPQISATAPPVPTEVVAATKHSKHGADLAKIAFEAAPRTHIDGKFKETIVVSPPFRGPLFTIGATILGSLLHHVNKANQANPQQFMPLVLSTSLWAEIVQSILCTFKKLIQKNDLEKELDGHSNGAKSTISLIDRLLEHYAWAMPDPVQRHAHYKGEYMLNTKAKDADDITNASFIIPSSFDAKPPNAHCPARAAKGHTASTYWTELKIAVTIARIIVGFEDDSIPTDLVLGSFDQFIPRADAAEVLLECIINPLREHYMAVCTAFKDVKVELETDATSVSQSKKHHVRTPRAEFARQVSKLKPEFVTQVVAVFYERIETMVPDDSSVFAGTVKCTLCPIMPDVNDAVTTCPSLRFVTRLARECATQLVELYPAGVPENIKAPKTIEDIDSVCCLFRSIHRKIIRAPVALPIVNGTRHMEQQQPPQKKQAQQPPVQPALLVPAAPLLENGSPIAQVVLPVDEVQAPPPRVEVHEIESGQSKKIEQCTAPPLPPPEQTVVCGITEIQSGSMIKPLGLTAFIWLIDHAFRRERDGVIEDTSQAIGLGTSGDQSFGNTQSLSTLIDVLVCCTPMDTQTLKAVDVSTTIHPLSHVIIQRTLAAHLEHQFVGVNRNILSNFVLGASRLRSVIARPDTEEIEVIIVALKQVIEQQNIAHGITKAIASITAIEHVDAQIKRVYDENIGLFCELSTLLANLHPERAATLATNTTQVMRAATPSLQQHVVQLPANPATPGHGLPIAPGELGEGGYTAEFCSFLDQPMEFDNLYIPPPGVPGATIPSGASDETCDTQDPVF